MKPFFSIVFGGLAVLMVIMGVFSFGVSIWHNIIPSGVATASVYSAVSSLMPSSASSVPETRYTGVERYTGAEEEDMINSAAEALPSNQVNRVTAKAYLVKDITNSQVIVENNSNQLLPIASLTKLVTAVVARKLILPTARIPITKQVMMTYGNTASFRAGETFTASDLMYPMLMVSSNDAAEAYAQYYGRAKFIQAMNDFTQSIGAYRTYFADPSGLDPQNVSTANDLALILDWIRKNDPSIITITQQKAKTIRSHTWVNPTHFLSWSYYVGGKNGYLPEADRTNASLFKLGPQGDIYAVVVLGSSSRDTDTLQLLKKVTDVISMRNL